MSTFDIDRLALVVATLERGGAEEVATGYFLTGDLVLTVRHAGGLGSVFAVRCESGETEEKSWSPATVVWEGTGTVDAMLLRTEKAFGTWANRPSEILQSRFAIIRRVRRAFISGSNRGT